MNERLLQAIDDYERKGWDFQEGFNACLFHGFVLVCPDFFSMGLFTDSKGDPSKAVQRHHADSCFVVYHNGDMRKALDLGLSDFSYIVFNRSIKTGGSRMRVLDLQTFFNKL